MQTQIEELALYLVEKLESTPYPTRVLVGIAGVPASGKSTLSLLLTERINALLDERTASALSADNSSAENTTGGGHAYGQAVLVGLDGWHLSRAQLDLLPDPQQAHDRRGIHWTFDGAGYVDFVRQLRDTTLDSTIITAPSFDHALKDPTPDAVSIYPHHRVVIIEGLYTILAVHPWSEAGLLLDERWFIEVDPVLARRRLVERHVLTGVTKDMVEAEWRADTNDGPNGQFIISNLLQPTRVIRSVDMPILAKLPKEAPVDINVA